MLTNDELKMVAAKVEAMRPLIELGRLPDDVEAKLNALPNYDEVPGWHDGHKTSFCAEKGCK